MAADLSGTNPGAPPEPPPAPPFAVPPPPPSASRAPTVRRYSLRGRTGSVFAAAAVLLVAAFVVSVVLLGAARHDRNQLLDDYDPALAHLNAYETALVGESIGARGYSLSGDSTFLIVYTEDVTSAGAASTQLSAEIAKTGAARTRLDGLDRLVRSWHRRYIIPEVATSAPGHVNAKNLTASTVAFDAIRRQFSILQQGISTQRTGAVDGFDRALVVLESVVAAVFAGVALLLLGLWIAMRRSVLRPLLAVGEDSRRVSAGELDHAVGTVGPAEVAELAQSIEAMRSRVVDDLHAIGLAHRELAEQERVLLERGEELARSNRDLEQFAYVASHDLQEPLRKVASFCQLLSDRYGDQLDDRAQQYIVFAVDGAKRMQALVNDLLAFSRVGRTRERWSEVDLGRAVDTARANLETRIEDVGGSVIVTSGLPTVLGDASLLSALFQNLIGNSLKFRGEDAPVVRVACRRDGERWELTVADNGIGIEPQYAERVFTIFQRLHTRDRYEGTGIGLALCRRIVEFHGGTIGIVPSGPATGTTIRFTLPTATGRHPAGSAPPDLVAADAVPPGSPTAGSEGRNPVG
jgi:signal transduction histidine kinase